MRVYAKIDPRSRKVLEFAVFDDEDAPEVNDDAEGACYRTLELDQEAVDRLRSRFWGVDPSTFELVELPFKVAVLDDDDVYIDKVELASSAELLASHVDLRTHGLGGDCDLAFGKYRWDREASTFIPLPKSGQRSGPSGVSLERAFADLCEQFGLGKLPKSTRAWVEQYHNSNDVRKKGR